ncbi:MAG: hypothetical protein RL745_759 [Actinomycetota bacterium]
MTEQTSSADDITEVDDLPEQMLIRRGKRERFFAEGHEPYPVSLPVTTTIEELRAGFGHLGVDEASGSVVGVAGRIMFIRNTGKLCFATLRSGTGATVQAMLSLDKVGEQGLESWKSLVDIGDTVCVEGEVITSKRGELSVLATAWHMAAKALRPLPVAHKPLNEQTRVRQRYVDLIMRPEANTMARMRPAVTASLRASLGQRGYTEVETPMLQTQHGGAAARPFITHMNAYDMELFLRIAPELFLKRCVVGGFDRVFEINRNFRNEGADSTHSPEFVMLEAYQTYADYTDMARITRESIQEAAMAVYGSLTFEHFDGTSKDLSGEWEWVSMYPALSKVVGVDITPRTPMEVLRKLCADAGVEPEETWLPGKCVEELFEHHVLPTLTGPTFVSDFPVDTSPLVRDHRSIPGVVEKWDLYIDGAETATGYSELTDPVIQRERLIAQSRLADRGDVEAMRLDEDFLRALEYGMPPTGGIGIGVDRVLMALTGVGIRETILFPLVKPE